MAGVQSGLEGGQWKGRSPVYKEAAVSMAAHHDSQSILWHRGVESNELLETARCSFSLSALVDASAVSSSISSISSSHIVPRSQNILPPSFSLLPSRQSSLSSPFPDSESVAGGLRTSSVTDIFDMRIWDAGPLDQSQSRTVLTTRIGTSQTKTHFISATLFQAERWHHQNSAGYPHPVDPTSTD